MSGRAEEDQAELFSKVARDATLSEKVAAEISQAILDGALAPGERLLSERELAAQFGVSRTVIREAVRSLVPSGLVEARSGRGLQVAAVGPQAVSRSMDVFLRRSRDIDYMRVNEVRAALEIDMAGYAAERATPADIEELRKLNEQLRGTAPDDVTQAAELDVAFHRAVAKATQNELFTVLLDAVGSVLLEVRVRAFAVPSIRGYAISAHEEIFDQIAAKAPDKAREAMRRHLHEAAETWSRSSTAAPSPQPAK